VRILWIKTELLHPVNKGGRIRTYQMLRALKSEHDITYVALHDGSENDPALALGLEYAQTVVRIPHKQPTRAESKYWVDLARSIVSALPFAVWRYKSDSLTAWLRRSVSRDKFDVVVVDFLAPAASVPDSLPVPVVLFEHNVETEIWRRHAESATRYFSRRLFRLQETRMRRFEQHLCKQSDLVVAVSDSDAEVLERDFGADRPIPVPTGVDTEYFRPQEVHTRVRAAALFVFVGSMDWLPNEEGVRWFCDAMWPGIRAMLPHARFRIVGRSPSPSILALASEANGVEVTGSVPDVRPHLEQATAMVVPLRIGGGTRLKIFEAMGMECPVISTTIGAEGLPVEHAVHLLIADGVEATIQACCDIVSNPGLASSLSENAAAFVRTHHSWSGVARAFSDACSQAIQRYNNKTRRV
jgi:glycosyltransferase involved in cell wall biosynthesis